MGNDLIGPWAILSWTRWTRNQLLTLILKEMNGPQRTAVSHKELSDVHYPTPIGCLFSWLVSTTYQDAMAFF